MYLQPPSTQSTIEKLKRRKQSPTSERSFEWGILNTVTGKPSDCEARDSPNSSEKLACQRSVKELFIDNRDIYIVRLFLQNILSYQELLRFDTDDNYKIIYFSRINPLVHLERCPLIARMLQSQEQRRLVDFASQRGLRSLSEASYAPRGSRTRARERESYVRTTDSNSNKENSQIPGKRPAKRTLKSMRERNEEIGVNKFNNSDSDQYELKRHKNQKDNNTNHKRIQKYLKDQRIDKIINTNENKHKNKDVAAEELSDNEKNNDAKPNQNVLARPKGINPLVHLERCPLIARMLQSQEQRRLVDFASQRGLRSLSEASYAPRGSRTRARERESYVRTTDSNSNKENSQIPGKRPAKRTLKSMRERNEEIGVNKFNNSDSDQYENKRHKNQKDNNKNHKRIQKYLKDQRIDKIINTNENKHKNKDVAAEELSDNEKNNDAKPNQNVLARPKGINPLVHLERCPLIARKLQSQEQRRLVDFASQLGLRSLSEASYAPRGSRTRARERESYVRTTDSNSNKENSQIPGKRPAKRTLKSMRERNEEIGVNKFNNSDSDQHEHKRHKNQKDNNKNHKRIQKYLKDQRIDKIINTNENKHKNKDVAAEELSDNEKNNDAKPNQNVLARPKGINPLVHLERCPLIARKLQSQEQRRLVDFASQLGLRSLSEASYAPRGSRTRARERESYVRTTDSNSNKENSQIPGKRPAKRTLKSMRERNEEIGVNKFNNSDSDQHEHKRHKNQKDNNKNHKRIQKYLKDQRIDKIINTNENKHKNKDVAAEELSDNEKNNDAKPNQNVLARPKGPAPRKYSSLEDHVIVSWVANGSRASQVNGNRLWREMQDQYWRIVGHCRTWHSLRNRYLRYILPRLGELAIPRSLQTRLRASAATGELKRGKRAAGARRNSMFALPPRGAASRAPRPPPPTPRVETTDDIKNTTQARPSSSPRSSVVTRRYFTRSCKVSEVERPPRRSPKLKEVDSSAASSNEDSSEVEGPPRRSPKLKEVDSSAASSNEDSSEVERPPRSPRPRLRRLFNPRADLQ